VTPFPETAAPPLAPGDVSPVVATSPHGDAPEPRCLNCGTPAGDHYCPRCGQAQTDYHRSLRAIVGDLLDTFAGWDAKIPRTLLTLIRRPGALTADHLAGRRARYVPPLRLYLTLSVVFFLSLRVAPVELTGNVDATAEADGFEFSVSRTREGAVAAEPRDSSAVARAARAIPGQPRSAADSAELDRFLRQAPPAGADTATVGSRVKRRLKHGMLTLQAMSPQQKRRALLAGFSARAANMVFVLLPIFALLLRVLYPRSPFFYAEHFVFSLHVHAMTMLAFTVLRFAPLIGTVRLPGLAVGKLLVLAIALWPPVYVYRAMRRVYGQPRSWTFAKYLVLGVTYGTIVLLSSIVTVLIGIFFLN
jgi:hypothetical protein